MKAGTAQGRRKITPKIRFPLINGWLAMIAVKIPMTICKVGQTNPVQQFVWWQVLEVVVGKGNHQGYDNRKDNRKSHRYIRWDNQKVWESIFINALKHILEGISLKNTIVETFSSRMCIFDIKDIKEQVNDNKDRVKSTTNQYEK